MWISNGISALNQEGEVNPPSSAKNPLRGYVGQRGKVPLPYPECDVHQPNKGWHLDERADDTDKCFARVQSEHRN